MVLNGQLVSLKWELGDDLYTENSLECLARGKPSQLREDVVSQSPQNKERRCDAKCVCTKECSSLGKSARV